MDKFALICRYLEKTADCIMKWIGLAFLWSSLLLSLPLVAETGHTRDKDIADIHALTKLILEQSTDPSQLDDRFILGFMLPADLKKYHVVTGAGGTQSKLEQLRESFAPGSDRFVSFIELMKLSHMQPIKFNDTGTKAVIDVGEKKGQRARFAKFKNQWFISF